MDEPPIVSCAEALGLGAGDGLADVTGDGLAEGLCPDWGTEEIPPPPHAVRHAMTKMPTLMRVGTSRGTKRTLQTGLSQWEKAPCANERSAPGFQKQKKMVASR